LFQAQGIGNIKQFESGSTGRFYLLSATEIWDEAIKLVICEFDIQF